MPDDVLSLATETMKDPVRVQIGHTAPADTVSHTFYPVETHLKTALLKHLLSSTETGPVLVFTRTKMRATSVGQKLARAGFNAIALHGNLSQNKRQEALDGFRSGRYKVLVATDVAARGIDVCGVSHVINYDIPDTERAYTHRIGRTGRACNTGDAFTFVTNSDKEPAHSIMRVLGDKLRHRTIKALDAGSSPDEGDAVRRHGGGRFANRSRSAAGRPGRRRNPAHSSVPGGSRGNDRIGRERALAV
jgi:ATP-dependent RNA helicase RhlE